MFLSLKLLVLEAAKLMKDKPIVAFSLYVLCCFVSSTYYILNNQYWPEITRWVVQNEGLTIFALTVFMFYLAIAYIKIFFNAGRRFLSCLLISGSDLKALVFSFLFFAAWLFIVALLYILVTLAGMILSEYTQLPYLADVNWAGEEWQDAFLDFSGTFLLPVMFALICVYPMSLILEAGLTFKQVLSSLRGYRLFSIALNLLGPLTLYGFLWAGFNVYYSDIWPIWAVVMGTANFVTCIGLLALYRLCMLENSAAR